MKKYRLNQLKNNAEGHFLQGILEGDYLCNGGLVFKKPGFRTHSFDGPGGKDYHVHQDDCEAFVMLQGKAQMEINGLKHDLATGDICVVEPGEDHHLISDISDPCVTLWLHAGAHRHPEQAE